MPLVVAHGNSLRALCMHLDALTPGEVTELNIPTGVPLRWDPTTTCARSCAEAGADPTLATGGVTEVLAQGRP